MPIFGQYTGQRIQPLPPEFLSTAAKQAEMWQEGISGMGEGVGKALEKSGKDKDERGMLEGDLDAIKAIFEADRRKPVNERIYGGMDSPDNVKNFGLSGEMDLRSYRGFVSGLRSQMKGLENRADISLRQRAQATGIKKGEADVGLTGAQTRQVNNLSGLSKLQRENWLRGENARIGHLKGQTAYTAKMRGNLQLMMNEIPKNATSRRAVEDAHVKASNAAALLTDVQRQLQNLQFTTKGPDGKPVGEGLLLQKLELAKQQVQLTTDQADALAAQAAKVWVQVGNEPERFEAEMTAATAARKHTESQTALSDMMQQIEAVKLKHDPETGLTIAEATELERLSGLRSVIETQVKQRQQMAQQTKLLAIDVEFAKQEKNANLQLQEAQRAIADYTADILAIDMQFRTEELTDQHKASKQALKKSKSEAELNQSIAERNLQLIKTTKKDRKAFHSAVSLPISKTYKSTQGRLKPYTEVPTASVGEMRKLEPYAAESLETYGQALRGTRAEPADLQQYLGESVSRIGEDIGGALRPFADAGKDALGALRGYGRAVESAIPELGGTDGVVPDLRESIRGYLEEPDQPEQKMPSLDGYKEPEGHRSPVEPKPGAAAGQELPPSEVAKAAGPQSAPSQYGYEPDSVGKRIEDGDTTVADYKAELDRWNAQLKTNEAGPDAVEKRDQAEANYYTAKRAADYIADDLAAQQGYKSDKAKSTLNKADQSKLDKFMDAWKTAHRKAVEGMKMGVRPGRRIAGVPPGKGGVTGKGKGGDPSGLRPGRKIAGIDIKATTESFLRGTRDITGAIKKLFPSPDKAKQAEAIARKMQDKLDRAAIKDADAAQAASNLAWERGRPAVTAGYDVESYEVDVPKTARDAVAEMKAHLVDSGATISPEVMTAITSYAGSQFPGEPAGVQTVDVKNAPGVKVLFDKDGKFLSVFKPPAMTPTDKAAIDARTVQPYTGWAGVAPTKEEAVKFRALNSNNNDIQDSLGKLLDMAEEGEIEVWGDKLARANALRAALVGKMRIPMTGGGPLTQEERKYISDNLMTNPYSATTLKSTIVAQLTEVKDMMDNAVVRTAEGIGLQPVTGGPAQSRRGVTVIPNTDPRLNK